MPLEPASEVARDRPPVSALHLRTGRCPSTSAIAEHSHLELDEGAHFRRGFLVGCEEEQPVSNRALRDSAKRRCLSRLAG